MTSAPRRAGSVWVALLRGVNVGGNSIVSMRALKESFERLGFQDVRTYINSGNVLFRASGVSARALERRIDRMLSRDYGLRARTVVRSRREMSRVVERIAREWTPDPAWKWNVMFLRHTVDAKRALAGFELKPGIERVVQCPGTWLWSARIRDMGRTAMMKVGKSPLYQEMTVRSVNTTKAILSLMESAKHS